MGFLEFLTTLAVAVVLPLAIVHLILSYRREKLKLRQGPSLGARELQQLVRQAVEEAQQPLLTRIEKMERQLRALPASHESASTEKVTSHES